MRRHDFMTLSTLSTFCILIILRQILTIWKTVWETWHLRHRLQFWRLRAWIQSIIVNWQLIVTLDSIHNSCDVSSVYDLKLVGILDQFRLNFSVWPTNKKFRVHPTAPLKKIHLVVRQNNKRPQSCRFYVLFVPMINSGGIKDTGGVVSQTDYVITSIWTHTRKSLIHY